MYSNSLAGVMAAALTLTFVTSTTIAQPNDTQTDKPKVRKDAQDDPLPPRAIARLGTLRLRGCRGPVLFSPDGKYIVTAGGEDGNQVVFWDRNNGRRVKVLKLLATESITRLVFSPDGKKLAGVGHLGFVNPLWDVDTGKVLFAFRGEEVAFRDKGKELVSTFPEGMGTKIRTFDVGTGRELTEWELVHPNHEGSLVLSPDGQIAAFSRRHAEGRELVIFDLTKRTEVKKLRLEQSQSPLIGFSGDRLRIVVGDLSSFIVWEWSSGKVLHRWEGIVGNQPSFSPDGRRIVWSGTDGHLIDRFWTAGVKAGQPHPLRTMTSSSWGRPAFSPDGKSVAVLTAGSAVILFDSLNGRNQLPVIAHDGRVGSVEYSPDGRHVLTCDSFRLLVWQTATGRLLRRLPDDLPQGETILLDTLSHGRILTVTLADGTMRLRDAATLRELRRLEGKHSLVDGPPWDLAAISTDGRFAAVLNSTSIRVYDLNTGAIRCQFTHDHANTLFMEFSADSRTLKVTIHQDFGKALFPLFYDARTGRKIETPADAGWWKRRDGRWLDDGAEAKSRLRELKLLQANGRPAFTGEAGFITNVQESPDGHYLAVEQRNHAIRLWDIVTRRPILELNEQHQIRGFSADGRMFVSSACSTGTIHLWEIATGRERLRLAGHMPGGVTIGFRKDSRVLVSGGDDTQVFLWDVTGRAPDGVRHEVRHSLETMRALWQALASDDAAAAYRAMWELIDAPAQTVACMREQLPPIAPVERRQLMRLLADLDSDEFAVRSKASEELERLGELAEPALRDALAAKPTLERRRRCEDLLSKLAVLSSQRLRAVRAVEVLEHIGTAEARALLERLSRGVPEARQTQEAKTALQRKQR